VAGDDLGWVILLAVFVVVVVAVFFTVWFLDGIHIG